MRIKAIICVALVAALAGACTYKSENPFEMPTPPPVAGATPLAKLELKRDAELEAAIAKIAAEAKGKVGVAAVVLETGDAALLNADDRFPMQSVYKLPISMAIMDQVRLEKLDLEEKVGVSRDDMVRAGMRSPLRDENPNGGEFTIRELIRLSLVESDGTASDVLMRVAGGAGEIQLYLTQIGVRDMKVVNTEKEIGRDWQTQYANWTAPIASVELLRWLFARGSFRPSSGPDDPDHPPHPQLDDSLLYEVLIDMKDSKPGVKRLRGLLPVDTIVPHKTGTGGTQNGITGATNDIGIIYLPNGKHLAIAVFVSDSPADEKTREAVIAKISKAAWDRWSKLPSGKTVGEIDLEIQGVGLDASVENVYRSFGKPDKAEKSGINECVNMRSMTLKYPGAEFYLLGDGGSANYSVSTIEITSGTWSSNGIRIGSGVNDVLQEFGSPHSRAGDVGSETLYYLPSGKLGWINFVFQDEKLSRITLRTTL